MLRIVQCATCCNMTHGVVDLCGVLFFFRRGKLDLMLTAYSMHVLDENTRSLLWPAFSLPYAESDALQFIFSNVKLNVAPGTSWLKSFSLWPQLCPEISLCFGVFGRPACTSWTYVFFCTVLSKIDGLGIYWDSETSWNIRKRFEGPVLFCFLFFKLLLINTGYS